MALIVARYASDLGRNSLPLIFVPPPSRAALARTRCAPSAAAPAHPARRRRRSSSVETTNEKGEEEKKSQEKTRHGAYVLVQEERRKHCCCFQLKYVSFVKVQSKSHLSLSPIFAYKFAADLRAKHCAILLASHKHTHTHITKSSPHISEQSGLAQKDWRKYSKIYICGKVSKIML